MREYILRRLLLFVPVLLGVSIVVFAIVRIIPGDIVDVKLAEQATPEVMAKWRHALGLDKPAHEQYFAWLFNVLRGDLGTSLWTGKPVLSQILDAAPISIELTILATFVSLIIAIPLGIVSAIRQDTWMDYSSRVLGILGLAVPNFWLGTLLLLLPSLFFSWTPPIRYRPFFDEPLANLQQFALPALALGAHFAALVMRMTRSSMLEVLRQDYVRTAWSKGLAERTVTLRHVLKNAAIPVVTVVGFEIGALLSRTVIVEVIFSLPGIGRLTLDAIGERDFVQLQGSMIFIAGIFLATNLVVDILYAYLDPRVHYR